MLETEIQNEIIAVSTGPVSKNYVVVNWLVNNVCNYRCSYCDSALWAGENRGTPWLNAFSFIQSLERNMSQKRIHFQLTGGEPTLWAGLTSLLSYSIENEHIVGLTTNGSRSLEFWEKFKTHFNWVNISYHSEMADHDHLLKLIETLASHCKLSIRVMMNPNPVGWNRCREFIELIKSSSFSEAFFVEVAPLTAPLSVIGPDARGMLTYSEEHWSIINSYQGGFWKESATGNPYFMGPNPSPWDHQVSFSNGQVKGLNPTDLIVSGQHRFKGWSCNAGIDNFFIDQDGFIIGATCRESKAIGNIKMLGSWTFPDKPAICPYNTCTCGTDMSIPKKKL